MKSIIKIKKLVLTVLAFSTVSLAYAEEAPVYDVDNYSQQSDAQGSAVVNNDTGPEPAEVADADNVPAPIPTASLTPNQRLAKVEHQVSNLQQTDVAAKITALQAEVQTLRGQLEEQTHQLQQLQNQQRTMYTDLDKRLNKETTQPAPIPEAPIIHNKIISKKKDSQPKTKVISAAPAAPAEAPVAAVQPNVAEEQQIYQTAYDLIKAKKFNDAIAALQKMLQKYPAGQFAANAHYWLGELYDLQTKPDLAASEFSAVVQHYPDSPKVADAQLKLGMIYAAQFKWSDAKTAFKKVITHYPGTATARLAAEQMKQIKLAGH
jgi:tol-pal system protein YbgF